MAVSLSAIILKQMSPRTLYQATIAPLSLTMLKDINGRVASGIDIRS
jgi:hypothetical protein